MRRFLLALTGTIAGLAALLSFKSMSSSAGTTDASSSPAPASSSAATSGGATSGGGTAAGTTTGTGKSSASKGGTTGGTALTGDVEQTPYGPMQVQITVSGKKITGVNILQHTDDGSESQEIDANALPQLTKETLAAQSARIDAVSGASYTSSGYIKSLQSAVDKL